MEQSWQQNNEYECMKYSVPDAGISQRKSSVFLSGGSQHDESDDSSR